MESKPSLYQRTVLKHNYNSKLTALDVKVVAYAINMIRFMIYECMAPLVSSVMFLERCHHLDSHHLGSYV
jgi:hypothetical protein